MHLGSATDDHLDNICSFIEEIGVERIICCHCTGDAGFEYLRKRLGAVVVQGRVGMEWSL